MLELTDSLRTGHPQIDAEHEKLFGCANMLIDAIGDSERFGEMAAKFFTMVEEHFVNEINILKELGFPRVEQHARFHEEAVEEMAHLRRQLETGSLLDMPELIQERTVGLLVHDILQEDMEFKSFLSELNEKPLA